LLSRLKERANPARSTPRREKSGRLKEMERSITEDKVFQVAAGTETMYRLCLTGDEEQCRRSTRRTHERSERGERTTMEFLPAADGTGSFPWNAINDDVANIVIAQLLFLESDNPERDIHIYINSPGGSVSAGIGDLRTTLQSSSRR